MDHGSRALEIRDPRGPGAALPQETAPLQAPSEHTRCREEGNRGLCRPGTEPGPWGARALPPLTPPLSPQPHCPGHEHKKKKKEKKLNKEKKPKKEKSKEKKSH